MVTAVRVTVGREHRSDVRIFKRILGRCDRRAQPTVGAEGTIPAKPIAQSRPTRKNAVYILVFNSVPVPPGSGAGIH